MIHNTPLKDYQIKRAANEITLISDALNELSYIAAQEGDIKEKGASIYGVECLSRLISMISDAMSGGDHEVTLESCFFPLNSEDEAKARQSGGGHSVKPVQPSTTNLDEAKKQLCKVDDLDRVSTKLSLAKSVLLSLQSNDNFDTLRRDDLASVLEAIYELIFDAENTMDSI